MATSLRDPKVINPFFWHCLKLFPQKSAQKPPFFEVRTHFSIFYPQYYLCMLYTAGKDICVDLEKQHVEVIIKFDVLWNFLDGLLRNFLPSPKYKFCTHDQDFFRDFCSIYWSKLKNFIKNNWKF